MKKLLISFFALVLSVGGFAQNVCNDSTPKWGESLGVISFRTDQTWVVEDQEWSDVVMASACQKDTFDGGKDVEVIIFSNVRNRKGENIGGMINIWGTFNADCRSVENYEGSLFSWCAVVRFQEQLCPAPWRVPTDKDFETLMNVINAGESRYSFNRKIFDRYSNIFGASPNEWRLGDGQLSKWFPENSSSTYWSKTELYNEYQAYILLIIANGYSTVDRFNKKYGVSLRCVRDN